MAARWLAVLAVLAVSLVKTLAVVGIQVEFGTVAAVLLPESAENAAG